MNLDRTHLTVGLLSALGTGLIGFMMFGATYGEMKGDLHSLDLRVAKLEESVGKVARPKVLKGDLCLELMQQYEQASKSPERLKDLEKQFEKLNCYDGVAANAMMPAGETEIEGRNP